MIVGVEFEYATTVEDPLKAAPSMRTGMGNVYAQTPIAVAGMKFYATTGAGGYREKLGTAHQETNIAFNTGGGVKMSLFGPLKARVDYRVFKLRGAPLYSVVHRVYAGVNLAFLKCADAVRAYRGAVAADGGACRGAVAAAAAPAPPGRCRTAGGAIGLQVEQRLSGRGKRAAVHPVELHDFRRVRFRKNLRDAVVGALHRRIHHEHVQHAAVGPRLRWP